MAQKSERRKLLEQTVKYVLFSASAGIVQVTAFTLLSEAVRLRYWPSYLIALVLSVLYNFTVNRRFTFRSANNVPLAMLLVAGYYLVFTPLSTWWGDRLTGIGWNGYVVLVGTMLVNFVTEFLFWRFVVFARSIDTNRLACPTETKKES
ncbi:MAG: GtrA family protein [Clostridia bacterium]|nr:GtrA family protein [Clostridia bacterium]